jgi:hypothetical protein
MDDSTIKKSAPKGTMGQTYLVSGKRVAMRLWQNEPPQAKESDELTLEGQTIKLQTGVSWVVSAQAEHSYRILEPFTAARMRKMLARVLAAPVVRRSANPIIISDQLSGQLHKAPVVGFGPWLVSDHGNTSTGLRLNPLRANSDGIDWVPPLVRNFQPAVMARP